MDLGERHLVVGLSGSAASTAALFWAAGEARRRGVGLRVVQARQANPVRAHYADVGTGVPECRQEPIPSAAASERLAVKVRAALGEAGTTDLSTEVVQGAPERLLISESDGADLLVLGSGGKSPVAQADPLIVDRPIGPVIRACLSHAHCPVVIIGQTAAAELAAGSPGPARGSAAGRRQSFALT